VVERGRRRWAGLPGAGRRLQPGLEAGKRVSAHCQVQGAGAGLALDGHRAVLDGPGLPSLRRAVGEDFQAVAGYRAGWAQRDGEDAVPQQVVAGGAGDPESPAPARAGTPQLQAHVPPAAG